MAQGKQLKHKLGPNVHRRPSVRTEPPQESTDRADPHESFGHLIRDVHRCFSRMLQEMIAGEDVTTPQWFFLRVLWDEDGLSQATLSNRVGLTTATTVVALNTLEKKGLIERQPHSSDGRKLIIKLTSRGRKMERKLRPCGKQVNDFASTGIPQEMLKDTKSVLQKMRANLVERANRRAKMD